MMTILLMCLSIFAGVAALITLATFVDKKTDSPTFVALLIVVLFVISIAMAFTAGTKAGSDCDNASVINQGGIK